MFPGFAPNREPPGCICARDEAALDGFADRYILSLNSLAYSDAREVTLLGCLRSIRKVKVENDFRPVHSPWTDEIDVHHTLVPVDHQIRVNPVVESEITLADCSCLLVCFLR